MKSREKLQSLAIEYRGAVINHLIDLERTMDIYLSRYFSDVKSKQDELLFLIFGNERITFGNKEQILNHLCKEKRISILDEYPSLLKDLKELIEKRNILAHYILDVSLDSQEQADGTIQFIKLKNSYKKQIFTQVDYLDVLDKIEKISDVLRKHANLLAETNS